MKLLNTKFSLGAIVASLLLTGCSTNFKALEPLTINRSGSFELDMDPDYALPLFTAPGEKLWIPPWDPIILAGDGFEEGTVWVTSNHGRTTYWYVSDYDTKARHAQYVRVTPGADSGTVNVWVRSNGKSGSVISVTYQLTGLSDSGNDGVRKLLGEEEYAKMMQTWQSMINESRSQIDAHFANAQHN